MTRNALPVNAAGIRMLLLDVDGVMTDGRLLYAGNGEETMAFHVRDGLGIRMAMNAGITVGVVTGRQSGALRHRCRDLGIELVFDGVQDKAAALDEIMAVTGIPAEQIAFVGDDLVDLPAMKRVGLPVAVADAHEIVQQEAQWVTRAVGGRGAVREVCEKIIQSKGLWKAVLETYRR